MWLGEWRSSSQVSCSGHAPHANKPGWVGVQEELGRSEAELRRTKAELEMMQLTSRRSVAGASLQDRTASVDTHEEVRCSADLNAPRLLFGARRCADVRAHDDTR